jgi:leader peptidase (prepilin peptidase)/N-methyltransferase
MFALLGVGYFAVTTIPLMVVDMRERRLPNKITIPGFLVSLVGLVLSFDWPRVAIALVVSALLFLVGTAISIRGWIGMGDVKLVAGLSILLAWFGLSLVWQAIFASVVLAGLVVAFGLLAKKITTRSTIALGPYLLVGFWLVITPPVWSLITR